MKMNTLNENKYRDIKALIEHLINNGLTISVWDGEAWAVKRSTNIKNIMSDINSVEMSECRIRDVDGNIKGWFGIAENEVYNHTENELFNSYFD